MPFGVKQITAEVPQYGREVFAAAVASGSSPETRERGRSRSAITGLLLLRF